VNDRVSLFVLDPTCRGTTLAGQLSWFMFSAFMWAVIVFVRFDRHRSRPWRIFAWAMFLLSIAAVIVAILDKAGVLGRL
jgi:hypothetical protein